MRGTRTNLRKLKQTATNIGKDAFSSKVFRQQPPAPQCGLFFLNARSFMIAKNTGTSMRTRIVEVIIPLTDLERNTDSFRGPVRWTISRR